MNNPKPGVPVRPTRDPALGPSDPGYYKQRVREGEQAMRGSRWPVRRLRDEVNGLTGSLERAEAWQEAVEDIASYMSVGVEGCDPAEAVARIKKASDDFVRVAVQRAERAEAALKEAQEVLRECADDLAIELDQRYGDSRKYPSEQRKYEAEMQPVYRARALLQSTGDKK